MTGSSDDAFVLFPIEGDNEKVENDISKLTIIGSVGRYLS